MKKWSILLPSLLALSPLILDGQQQCTNGGCIAPLSPSQISKSQISSISPTAVNNLALFKNYVINGDYVVVGIGVRGSGVGTIQMTGVPAGAQIRAAYLYWETLGNGQIGSFNGTVLSGIPL